MKSVRRWRLSTDPEGQKRCEPGASVIGLVPEAKNFPFLDEENGFVKVSIEEGDGWVSEDYVVVATEYVTAESIEEESRIAEEKARRRKESRAGSGRAYESKGKKQRKGKNAEITDKSTSSRIHCFSAGDCFIFWFRLGTVRCKLCGTVCR